MSTKRLIRVGRLDEVGRFTPVTTLSNSDRVVYSASSSSFIPKDVEDDDDDTGATVPATVPALATATVPKVLATAPKSIREQIIEEIRKTRQVAKETGKGAQTIIRRRVAKEAAPVTDVRKDLSQQVLTWLEEQGLQAKPEAATPEEVDEAMENVDTQEEFSAAVGALVNEGYLAYSSRGFLDAFKKKTEPSEKKEGLGLGKLLQNWTTKELTPDLRIKVRKGAQITVRNIGTAAAPAFEIRLGSAAAQAASAPSAASLVPVAKVAGLPRRNSQGPSHTSTLVPIGHRDESGFIILATLAKGGVAATKAGIKEAVRRKEERKTELKPGDQIEVGGVGLTYQGNDEIGAIFTDTDNRRVFVADRS